MDAIAQAMMRKSICFVLGIAGLAFITDSALAQQVPTDPTSTHIFPAGGRRGTRIDARVGGECLPPGTRIRFFGDGVSAALELGAEAIGNDAPSPRRKPSEQPVTHPREWQSQIEISNEAPLGLKLWRLSCARGGTDGRPFIVGDLPEFIESEPNSLPENAEQVEMPVTINGQIAGESDLDYFRFQAMAGDVVRVDVVANRLGSALDPVIQLIGPDGNRVAVSESRIGADPVLAFRSPVSGEYRLMIANITYRGGPNYVYRMTLSTAPLIQFAFPPGGQAGSSQEIAFFALDGDGQQRVVTNRVTFPASPGEFCQCGLPGSNSVPLLTSSLREETEASGNDSRDSATEVSWPLIVNARFETASDEDWFRVNCRKATPLTIDCLPFPRGSPALPVVSIINGDGTVLVSANSVQTERGTIHIDWQPPADGSYWLRARDLQQGVRGGPEFIYRLCINEATPDFAVTLKSDAVNVVQGGRTEVDVAIERRGFCVAPIELIVEGLPEGIRIEGQQVVPGQASAKLVFIAAADARSQDLTIRIKGKAEVNGTVIERVAVATHLGHDVDGVGLGSTEIDHVQLTIVHKPVFKLYCNEAYQYAHRGTIYPYLMEIERLNGFDGPIHLQVADRQIKDLDGIEVLKTTVLPDQRQFMLPLYLPETMHINVQAHSNVYAQGYVEFKDQYEQKQTLLVVSTMRCMVRTLPTVVKLRTIDRVLTLQPGHSVHVGFALDRTSQFSGAMQIELIDAPEGVTAAPAEITADQTQAAIQVNVASTINRASQLAFRFRATGKMAGNVSVITEATVPVQLEN